MDTELAISLQDLVSDRLLRANRYFELVGGPLRKSEIQKPLPGKSLNPEPFIWGESDSERTCQTALQLKLRRWEMPAGD